MDIYEKILDCFVCGSKIKVLFVKSLVIFVESRDIDFCVYYKGVNFFLYDVIVCGECGYVVFSKNFGKFIKWDVELLKEKVVLKWVKREILFERIVDDVVMLYKFVLIIVIFKRKVNKYEVVGILLRILWFYRLSYDKEKEFEF